MNVDRKKLRVNLALLGFSLLLGGGVTFFGYVAEALVDAFGKPVGLGVFVAFTSLLFVLVSSERHDDR